MARYYNASIRNLVYRLRKFKPILEESLKEEIERNQDVITDIIRTQLYAGIDGYKNDIKPPYTARTVKNKIRKGQPTDRVTLKDTGKFYKSLYVEFDSNGFRILSDDKKAEDLLEKYGEQVLRMTNSELTDFLRTHIRPVLTEKMKNYIKNG